MQALLFLEVEGCANCGDEEKEKANVVGSELSITAKTMIMKYGF